MKMYLKTLFVSDLDSLWLSLNSTRMTIERLKNVRVQPSRKASGMARASGGGESDRFESWETDIQI